jgi:hypothetical protein
LIHTTGSGIDGHLLRHSFQGGRAISFETVVWKCSEKVIERPSFKRCPKLSLSDGTKLPPTEEEIIDLFLGRKLHVGEKDTSIGDAAAGAKA